MAAKEVYLKHIIKDQHQGLRFYVMFAAGLVFVGITVILISSLSSDRLIPEALKAIIGIGGGFVSSLSAFPIKEMRTRKEKLGMLKLIEIDLHSLEQQGELADLEKRKRIYDLIDEIVKVTLTGKG
jgi:hypothetical protein